MYLPQLKSHASVKGRFLILFFLNVKQCAAAPEHPSLLHTCICVCVCMCVCVLAIGHSCASEIEYVTHDTINYKYIYIYAVRCRYVTLEFLPSTGFGSEAIKFCLTIESPGSRGAIGRIKPLPW